MPATEMTRRLEEAFRAASALCAEEQDALVEVIRAEVTSDAKRTSYDWSTSCPSLKSEF
jgi:hypothetical protein